MAKQVLKAAKSRVRATHTEQRAVAQLAVDSLIREWILGDGTRVQTVTLQQDDGRYVSAAVSNPKLRASGKTRQAAEDEVLKQLADRESHWVDDEPPEAITDDLRVAQQRSKERTIPLADLKKKFGYQ